MLSQIWIIFVTAKQDWVESYAHGLLFLHLRHTKVVFCISLVYIKFHVIFDPERLCTDPSLRSYFWDGDNWSNNKRRVYPYCSSSVQREIYVDKCKRIVLEYMVKHTQYVYNCCSFWFFLSKGKCIYTCSAIYIFVAWVLLRRWCYIIPRYFESR